jgi:hypothetical protein
MSQTAWQQVSLGRFFGSDGRRLESHSARRQSRRAAPDAAARSDQCEEKSNLTNTT